MADEKLDRRILIQAITDAHGKLSVVARAMDVTYQTIRNYAKRYPTVQTAIDQARNNYDDGLLDEAELALRAAVREKAAWAVRYVLDTKGKNRGYVKQQELIHDGEFAITVNYGTRTDSQSETTSPKTD